jgi:hypothetical protein
MLDTTNDLGASLYKSWTEQQRCDEIEKLVIGYRNGIPIGILCKMSETIAGNRKKARKYLQQFLSAAERKAAVEAATVAMSPIVKAFLA